jgi:hypothetical protein
VNKRYRRLSLFVLSLGLVACDAILGIPQRSEDPTVVCGETGCQCAEGRGDCDGDERNGCEADLHHVMSCGGCGNQCLNGDCAEGACSCNQGFFDCDGLASNGCETDLSSAGNCGGCKNRCLNGNCIDASCDCKPGFLDCDGLAENGCETSVDDDQDHCGACGHSCLGGSCEGGRCLPVQLFEGTVRDVALVDDEFYFLSDFSVKKLPKSGAGQPATVCDYFYPDDGFMVSDGFIFGASYFEGVMSCPLAGGASTTVVTSTSPDAFFEGFGVGGGWLYWSMFDYQIGQGGVFRAPADGTSGTPQFVDNVDYGASVSADATHVYWISGGDIYMLNHELSGAETRSVAPYYADDILAVDEKNLYLSSYDLLGTEEVVHVVPLGAGEPQIMRGLFCGYDCLVAADAQHLYLANPLSGILRRARLTSNGDESEILRFDEGFTGSRIILDDKAIYWGTNKGLFRLAK